MSEPIKVGDLVQVVRSCCAKRVHPTVFVVGKIIADDFHKWGQAFCLDCGTLMPSVAFAHPRDDVKVAQPITWLKRIPPLSELGDVETKEEQPA